MQMASVEISQMVESRDSHLGRCCVLSIIPFLAFRSLGKDNNMLPIPVRAIEFWSGLRLEKEGILDSH